MRTAIGEIRTIRIREKMAYATLMTTQATKIFLFSLK